jgi:hypothetical protein
MKDTFPDVKATLYDRSTVIIEMQVLNVLGFEKRVLYNAAKAFSIQLDAGQAYAQLNPVIVLTIADFEMFPDSPNVISRYSLKEKEDLTAYSDDMEHHRNDRATPQHPDRLAPKINRHYDWKSAMAHIKTKAVADSVTRIRRQNASRFRP